MINDKTSRVRSVAALLGGNPFSLASKSWGSGKERGVKQRETEGNTHQGVFDGDEELPVYIRA